MKLALFSFIILLSLLSLNLSANELPPDQTKHLRFESRESPNYRFELTPYIGDYLGDKFSHSMLSGGLVSFRALPSLSFNLDFGWTLISSDASSAFGRSLTNNNLYLIEGSASYNIPIAFLSKGRVIENDLFTTIGGGSTIINNVNRFSGFIGGGILSLFKKVPWLGLRVEIRNYFSTVPTISGKKFSSDLTLTVGPTFRLVKKP